MLKKCNHPNVIKLVDALLTLSHLYIVMVFLIFVVLTFQKELASGPPLFDYLLAKPENYTEETVRSIVTKITRGIDYLHQQGVVHRDIKLENLLFLDDSLNAEIKIVDFG